MQKSHRVRSGQARAAKICALLAAGRDNPWSIALPPGRRRLGTAAGNPGGRRHSVAGRRWSSVEWFCSGGGVVRHLGDGHVGGAGLHAGRELGTSVPRIGLAVRRNVDSRPVQGSTRPPRDVGSHKPSRPSQTDKLLTEHDPFKPNPWPCARLGERAMSDRRKSPLLGKVRVGSNALMELLDADIQWLAAARAWATNRRESVPEATVTRSG